jgi:predicted ATPase
MINQLKVKNYRSLADVTVNFELLTVLVGPNGSGKSNLVDVLRFVSEALIHGLDSAVIKRHGMSALRRWSGKGRPYDVEIGLSISGNGILAADYQFTLGGELRGEYRVKSERCEVYDPSGPFSKPLSKFETLNGEWSASPMEVAPSLQPTALALPLLTGLEPFRLVYDLLTSMSFYNIVPNDLTEPQKPANAYPLTERGDNLASLLRDLRRGHTTVARELENALSSVMGDILGYQVAQVGGYLVTKLRHTGAGKDQQPLFELSQESDGTLRLLGILSALYQTPPRGLIALEEPELTIHPGVMSLLWEEIQAAAQRRDRQMQVVLTTHSPDLLDMCEADQIRVVEKISGITHVGPVAEEQRQIIQQKLFAPGQLLQAQSLRRAGAV